jgi:hypothetical protein
MNQDSAFPSATVRRQAAHHKRPLETITLPPHEDVRHWIASIHASLTTKQRLTRLRRLQTEFLEVADEATIHCFVELGGLRALLLQLGLVLDRRRQGGTVHEIHSLVRSLYSLLHRSSQRDTVLETLDGPALRLFAQAWRDWEAPQIPAVAHWISACATGTALLLEATPPVLLHVMLALLVQPPPQTNAPTEDDDEIQNQVLGFFKNISYFDRQASLLATPLFATALTQVSLDTRQNPVKPSAIWRNLALTHEGRTRLKQSEMDLRHVLYTLATNDEANVAVRRNVLSTLITLSMDHEFCLLFLLYGDGLYVRLMEAWLSSSAEPDETTRKRAARTIRLWVSQAASASLLVQSASLMGELSATAVQDPSAEVRHEAAEAFGRCASWIQSPMPQHQAVLEALAVLCRSAPAAIVARAIKGQAALANNRSILLDQPILVERLIAIAGQADAGSLTREDACTALAHLASVPSNQRRLLSYPLLLDSLCQNLPSLPATETIVALASDVTNRTPMVRHDRLLKGLIRCAAQPGHPRKEELKKTILLLVEEL